MDFVPRARSPSSSQSQKGQLLWLCSWMGLMWCASPPDEHYVLTARDKVIAVEVRCSRWVRWSGATDYEEYVHAVVLAVMGAPAKLRICLDTSGA